MKSALVILGIAAMTAGMAATMAAAPSAPRPQVQSTPRDQVQFDPTGTWVPLITEDWLYRMAIPKRGDLGSIPLNPEGRRVAEAWDGTVEGRGAGSCKAYGAPSIMRMPGRMRVSWDDPATLKMEFAAGNQVRRLHFADNLPPQGFVSTDPPQAFGRSPMSSGGKSLQGHSIAAWHRQAQSAGLGFVAPGSQDLSKGGSLVVLTSNLKAGYLQPNGVPYSDGAELTEYFTTFKFPDGTDGLVVTAIVEDSAYLRDAFVRSTHFKRERKNVDWVTFSCLDD